MKKTAIILILGLVAIIAALLLWLYRPVDEFDPSQRKPLLFPPQESWPTNVLESIELFRVMPETNRIAQGHEFCRFTRWYEYQQEYNNVDPDSIPLMKEDIRRLFGAPSGEIEDRNIWFYRTEITEGAISCLDFYFNRNKLSAVFESVGSLSSPIINTTETHSGSEQSGPGYPPQGVGSPDP